MQNNSGRKEIHVSDIGPGGVFGEIALLHHCKRTATVKAKTWCDLLTLQNMDFERVTEKYPMVRHQLSVNASKRINENKLDGRRYSKVARGAAEIFAEVDEILDQLEKNNE